jgi:MoaA/NifB/PqqE/SkfB family radical SAM enzyme
VTTQTRTELEAAIAAGRIGDRLWLYATYHCNLECVYCLTESSPRIADRRALDQGAMLGAVEEAAALGLRSVGITGGEVFMLPWFPETLVAISEILPTIALTNGTLFTDGLLDRLAPLADLDCALQISLDSDRPDRNDRFRGPENFAKVVHAVPRLVDRGIGVRIATTVEDQVEEELQGVCELHRSWGIGDEDHIVRPVVRRGRAEVEGMGVDLAPTDAVPELTLTADGCFMHPFAPTVRHGRTDLDLLASRQIVPLEAAARRFLRIAANLPAGADVVRNLR